MDLNEGGSQTATLSNTKPKATVLVPLYIYPLNDETWKPLYDAYVWPDNSHSLTLPVPKLDLDLTIFSVI